MNSLIKLVPNDKYVSFSEYRTVIESRVIGFTWCMDMILFPKDPYGRKGPLLEEILNRVVAVQ